MVLLILSMLCIGAALGVRFKVLILIPAIGLAFMAIVAGGVARGDSALAILIAAVLASSGLQIGYLCCIMRGMASPVLRAPTRQRCRQNRRTSRSLLSRACPINALNNRWRPSSADRLAPARNSSAARSDRNCADRTQDRRSIAIPDDGHSWNEGSRNSRTSEPRRYAGSEPPSRPQ